MFGESMVDDGRKTVGAGGVGGGTPRARESPPPLADFSCFKALASVRHFEESIIEPASVKITKQRLTRVRKNESTCGQTTEVLAIQVSSHKMIRTIQFKQGQVSASKIQADVIKGKYRSKWKGRRP